MLKLWLTQNQHSGNESQRGFKANGGVKMMYITHTITPDHTKLVVGQFYENTDLLVVTPKRETLRIPRLLVETPVLCCPKCGKPALLKVEKHTKREYAECPDHARHTYEALYAASHDNKRYNRAQQRKLHKEAGVWLKAWRRVHINRGEIKPPCVEVDEWMVAESEKAFTQMRREFVRGLKVPACLAGASCDCRMKEQKCD